MEVVQGSPDHFDPRFVEEYLFAPTDRQIELQSHSKSLAIPCNVFYVAALVMFVREKREIGAYRITAPRRANDE